MRSASALAATNPAKTHATAIIVIYNERFFMFEYYSTLVLLGTNNKK